MPSAKTAWTTCGCNHWMDHPGRRSQTSMLTRSPICGGRRTARRSAFSAHIPTRMLYCCRKPNPSFAGSKLLIPALLFSWDEGQSVRPLQMVTVEDTLTLKTTQSNTGHSACVGQPFCRSPNPAAWGGRRHERTVCPWLFHPRTVAGDYFSSRSDGGNV